MPENRSLCASTERKLFDAALDLKEAARQAFLDDLGIRDSAMAARIAQLIEAEHRSVDSVFERSADNIRAQAVSVMDDPKRIGQYRILERIGDGGMGVVYLAEQTEPVRRKVAIKIIKIGMDTDELLARFSIERQALALMNHPGIARIYEAGATENGRPYFAMEYVPGVPVTRYCDDRKLNIDRRLALLSSACAAVQHAHQKGIIHRDIKPENILVAEENGEPVLKVIDFGVAKALDHQLTAHPAHTRIGGTIGTLEYMSPEQAALNPNNIDTRSDVYSLGAVLYELMIGQRPTAVDAECDSAEQIKRSIRDEAVLSLKDRLLTLPKKTLENVAAGRATSEADLRAEVTAELSWVAAKALSKDPGNRYQTARDFANDIQAYLSCEPVAAGPDKFSYKFKSYARRNKVAVVATLSVIVALTIGFFMSAVGFLEASKERDHAQAAQNESEAVTQFLIDMLTAPDPAQKGRDVTVREVLGVAKDRVLNEFSERPLLAGKLLASIGDTYMEIGMLGEAETTLTEALAIYKSVLSLDHTNYLNATHQLGRIYHRLGRYDEAESVYLETFEGRKRVLGLSHKDTVSSLNNLGIVYGLQGRYLEALTVRERVLDLDIETHGVASENALSSKNNLALSYMTVARFGEALALLREAVSGRTRLYGADHPKTLNSRTNLGNVIAASGSPNEAIPLLTEALLDAERVFGEQDWRTLITRHSLANALATAGFHTRAEEEYLAVIELRHQVLGETHPETLMANLHFARMLNDEGRFDAAESLLEKSVPAAMLSIPADSAIFARYRTQYGRSLLGNGKPILAEKQFAAAYEILRPHLPMGSYKVSENFIITTDGLAEIYRTRSDTANAERYERERNNAMQAGNL